ncbi:MAG TPA: hypothetical protein PKH29_12490 [Oscillospiraceae bacterium]|nr:hypothetical protein [Oscillospiraceae bacterium]
MTNKEFVRFCEKALGKNVRYMWGTYGQKITDKLIASKTIQYPDHYPQSYQDELHAAIADGGIGCDCTGLIKWFLWTGGNIEKAPKYDGVTDTSASGWYNRAKVRGEIDAIPERPGLIVSKKGHCGVYVGNGDVIECAKGEFGNGVVRTKLTDRAWEKWCECVYIDYKDKPENEIATVPCHVSKDSPVYTDFGAEQRIGTVFDVDSVEYIGVRGINARGMTMAAIIYPTKTEKIGFVDKSVIVF